MEKKLFLFCLAYFILVRIVCYSQAPISYGSNNGKYLSVNGVKLYYEEYGAGTPLLLIHGGLSSIEGLT
jgi:hypothetical protein